MAGLPGPDLVPRRRGVGRRGLSSDRLWEQSGPRPGGSARSGPTSGGRNSGARLRGRRGAVAVGVAAWPARAGVVRGMASTPLRTAGTAAALGAAAIGLVSAARAARRRLLGAPVGSGGPGSARLPLAVTVHVDEQTLEAHPAVDGLRALTGVDVEPPAGPRGPRHGGEAATPAGTHLDRPGPGRRAPVPARGQVAGRGGTGPEPHGARQQPAHPAQPAGAPGLGPRPGRWSAVRALTWQGVNDLAVQDVPDARVQDEGDVVLKVLRSTTCGSDLHLIGGYIPAMESGDVLGHEFLGEVVEVGPAVRRHSVGDRVVVSSFIACGRCWYCSQERYSPVRQQQPEPAAGGSGSGARRPAGASASRTSWAGTPAAHAEYVRVPFADVGAFTVPEAVGDERALFASDAAPTGWMGADLGGVSPGDVVAVWGAGGRGPDGGPGRHAARRGARRGPGPLPERLAQVREHVGAETLDVHRGRGRGRGRRGAAGDDGRARGRRRHRGRGHGGLGQRVAHAYDQVKQQLRLQTDRPTACARRSMNTRKGGSVFVLGRLRARGRQVPARGRRQQGPDPAGRADARPALHPDAARADGRRASWSPSTWPRTPCRWRTRPRATGCSREGGRLRALGVRPGRLSVGRRGSGVGTASGRQPRTSRTSSSAPWICSWWNPTAVK